MHAQLAWASTALNCPLASSGACLSVSLPCRRLTVNTRGESVVQSGFHRAIEAGHCGGQSMWCFKCGNTLMRCECTGAGDKNLLLEEEYWPRAPCTDSTPADRLQYHKELITR